MSLTVWLIRHGQTTINAGEWHEKPTETRLTALGKEQAERAAMQVDLQPDLLITSPLIRAQESAAFVLQRFPKTATAIWPIQEFSYVSATTLQTLDQEKRKAMVDSYWKKNNPFDCDGDGAESFDGFLKRVVDFHQKLTTLKGFVVVVGHGHFFKAYQLGLKYGFKVSPEWMSRYRQEELQEPIKNGEILKISLNNNWESIH